MDTRPARTHGHGRKGENRTRTYRVWSGMLSRCRNPNVPSFKYYGGRGIRVCDRWRSFECFLADMGECPPNMSIDRIDNDGNYEPSNCRWATSAEQHENRRTPRTVKLTPDLVQEVRGRLDYGEPAMSIARRMRISETTVSNIKTGKRWSSVP